MNTLRLNIINLHAPYRVWQKIRWFNTYEHRDLYYIQTAEGMMEGQMNFVAIISRLTCPSLPLAIEEFSETISLLFDIEEE